MNAIMSVDIEELKTKRKQMQELFESLDEEFINCARKIDETREFFYTPTADYFREKVSDFIYHNIHTYDNISESLSTSLDSIIKSYESLDSAIKTGVGDR